MEETSARVMEMVEMVPVARLMPWRIRKRPGSAPSLKKQPTGANRLDMVQAHFGAVSWVVFQVFQVVCLAVSGFMAMSGLIKVGDVTFYQSSFTTVVNQFLL